MDEKNNGLLTALVFFLVVSYGILMFVVGAVLVVTFKYLRCQQRESRDGFRRIAEQLLRGQETVGADGNSRDGVRFVPRYSEDGRSVGETGGVKPQRQISNQAASVSDTSLCASTSMPASDPDEANTSDADDDKPPVPPKTWAQIQTSFGDSARSAKRLRKRDPYGRVTKHVRRMKSSRSDARLRALGVREYPPRAGQRADDRQCSRDCDHGLTKTNPFQDILVRYSSGVNAELQRNPERRDDGGEGADGEDAVPTERRDKGNATSPSTTGLRNDSELSAGCPLAPPRDRRFSGKTWSLVHN